MDGERDKIIERLRMKGIKYACPLCKSKEFRLVYSIDRAILECRLCGLVMGLSHAVLGIKYKNGTMEFVDEQ